MAVVGESFGCCGMVTTAPYSNESSQLDRLVAKRTFDAVVVVVVAAVAAATVAVAVVGVETTQDLPLWLGRPVTTSRAATATAIRRRRKIIMPWSLVPTGSPP